MKLRKFEIVSEGLLLTPWRGGALCMPAKRMNPRPTVRNPIVAAAWDPDIGRNGVAYRLRNGREGVVVWDQALDANRDPEYLATMQLHRARAAAVTLLRRHTEGMSVREIAKRIGTSTSQVQRMLAGEPTASLDAIIRALGLLGVEVEVRAA